MEKQSLNMGLDFLGNKSTRLLIVIDFCLLNFDFFEGLKIKHAYDTNK